MHRTLSAVGVAMLSVTLLPAPAAAQVPDHLKCYRIKDPQPKATYAADLAGLAAEPGCRVRVPATLACVPTTKTNVTPAPPGGGGTGTPNSFFCYRVKCPRTVLPALAGTDQFGSRTVTPRTATLLCAPLAPPTTTTTATTSTTTTSTTPVSCGPPDAGGQCNGVCPGTQVCLATGASSCGCFAAGTGCFFTGPGQCGGLCQNVHDVCSVFNPRSCGCARTCPGPGETCGGPCGFIGTIEGTCQPDGSGGCTCVFG